MYFFFLARLDEADLIYRTEAAKFTAAVDDIAERNAKGQPVLVGTVLSVTDGDTIKVQLSSGPMSVRFHSIDAPEKDQPWGMRDFVVIDPSGVLWRIAQNILAQAAP